MMDTRDLEILKGALANVGIFVFEEHSAGDTVVLGMPAKECIDDDLIRIKLRINASGDIYILEDDTGSIAHFYAWHDRSEANEMLLDKIVEKFEVMRDSDHVFITSNRMNIGASHTIHHDLLEALMQLTSAIQHISVVSEIMREDEEAHAD